MIGGALLDLVGVPLLSGAVSMEGVGTAAVIAGSATVGSALSKMNVPVGSVQYSFAKGYEERRQNIGKTSETTVKNVEGKVRGKSSKFRVDVEPDGDKIQVQSGKGKSSKDIRIRPEKITDDDKSIIEQIEENNQGVKFNKNSMEQLVKGIRKAMDRLK
ncbi:hypothetical protein [Lactovum odontotermitis]